MRLSFNAQNTNNVHKSKANKIYPSPITVRFTNDEREQLKKDANGASISAHIRWCSLKKQKKRKIVPVAEKQALAQILGLLGQTRFANNLNQIAYEANCGSLLMDETTEEEIKLACAHIAFIRVKLIEALGLNKGSKK
uniref:Bacterial mobilisation domain-containing protein n=1 Tax=OCS116 cluster bacterium TaxID=2030921 RepID=A0A2A4Z3Y4_9PROT